MRALTTLLARCLDSRRVAREIRAISYRGPAAGRGVYVLNTVGCYINDVSSEFYCAYLLALDGYQVKILLDDDYSMEHWEYVQATRGPGDFRFHKNPRNKIVKTGYAWLSRRLFAHPNIEIIPYSKMLAAEPETPELSESDLLHVDSTIRRYYSGVRPQELTAEQQPYHEASIRNARLSKRIGMYVERFIKPAVYMDSHGIYSTWGPCWDHLAQRGFKCLVFTIASYRPQRAHVMDAIPNFMTTSSSWRAYRGGRLDDGQRRAISEYFDGRLGGRAPDLQQMQARADAARVELKPGEFRAVYAMFPNVIWDADIAQRNTIFDGPLEWIVETIRFFESRPDLHLVIRFHPAEATFMAYSKKLEPMVRQKVPHLDDIPNVTVFGSAARVRSYDIVRQHADVGLLYEGLLGLEMPYMDVPVVTAARARYFGAGNSFEPADRPAYFDLLGAPEQVAEGFACEQQREKALFFGYWYLYVASLLVPSVERSHFGFFDYDATTADLDPARQPELLETLRAMRGEN